MQLGVSELGGAVDGDKEIQPPLFGAYLGDIEMEGADGVSRELLLCALVTADLGQGADAVTRLVSKATSVN